MRFRSIFWRLVATYVGLTILVVGLVGLVAVSLIRRHAARQEVEYLTANAQVIARQALPLMQTDIPSFELHHLVTTAAFLGNTQVKILDAQSQVLADSGPRGQVDELVWLRALGPANDKLTFHVSGERILVTPPMLLLTNAAVPSDWSDLPPEMIFAHAARQESPWGNRFDLEVVAPPAQLPAPPQPAPDTLMKSIGAPADTMISHPMSPTLTARSSQVVNVPIGTAAAPLGFIELSGGPNTSAETLPTIDRAFGLAGSVAVLAAFGMSWLVSRRLAAPMYALTSATNRMSHGDLAVRAPVTGHDEIAQLARQFNHMAERLETSFSELAAERDTLRRFVADASHELRTPITALKTFNELLQTRAAHDPQARAEFLQESAAQLDRLETITHHLLDLSRLDAGLITLDQQPHDANELLEAVAQRFRPVARERSITLTVDHAPHDLAICGDRPWLESALANLLDNALKWTPAAGTVTCEVQQHNQQVRLTVRDSGSGISAADLPHIFERFYRGQPQHIPGNGLGLAIVHSVIQAHNGHIRVQSQPGQGTSIAIDLPMLAPSPA